MTAANYLLNHLEVSHGKVRLCFNPDEEIGRGTHKIRPRISRRRFCLRWMDVNAANWSTKHFRPTAPTSRSKGTAFIPANRKANDLALRAAAKIVACAAV